MNARMATLAERCRFARFFIDELRQHRYGRGGPIHDWLVDHYIDLTTLPEGLTPQTCVWHLATYRYYTARNRRPRPVWYERTLLLDPSPAGKVWLLYRYSVYTGGKLHRPAVLQPLTDDRLTAMISAERYGAQLADGLLKTLITQAKVRQRVCQPGGRAHRYYRQLLDKLDLIATETPMVLD